MSGGASSGWATLKWITTSAGCVSGDEPTTQRQGAVASPQGAWARDSLECPGSLCAVSVSVKAHIFRLRTYPHVAETRMHP